MDTLSEIFTESNVPYRLSHSGDGLAIEFSEYFSGDESDFLYIEFEGLPNDITYTLYDYFGEYPQPENSSYFNTMMKEKYNNGMKVNIVWLDDAQNIHTMHCDMDNGKLLIPLGAGVGWLLDQHNLICITVSDNGVEIPIPDVSEVKLLKLQEVETNYYVEG